MHIRNGFFGLLVIAVLLAVVIPLTVTTDGTSANGDDSQHPIPEKPELTYPNLGSALDQLVAGVEEGKTSAREAAGEASVNEGKSVAVTIHLSGSVDEVVSFLEDNGGSPRNVGEDYIEAYVPVTLLGKLSEQPGVLRVREIVPPQPAYGGFTSQGVLPHFSDTWNRAGISGQGVKVGVIDLPLGFNGFRSLMGAELPETVRARCYTEVGVFTGNLADCENDVLGSDHGTNVAETLIDIAPEVELYIATPVSYGDLQNTVEWMASQGVSVINYSLTARFDGPGDGTSPYSLSPLRTVDRAVDGGTVWVNAAGNYAESAWFGTYSVQEVGEYWFLEFDGGDIFNDVPLFAGEQLRVELRWDDSWGGASRDLDLVLWDVAAGEIVAGAYDPQLGGPGHDPWEALVYQVPRDGIYSLLVNHFRGSAPDWIADCSWWFPHRVPHRERRHP